MKRSLKENVVFSGIMIGMMVAGMSLYNVVRNGGINEGFWSSYLSTVALNIVVAAPLQLLIVGPTARWALRRVQLNAKQKRD